MIARSAVNFAKRAFTNCSFACGRQVFGPPPDGALTELNKHVEKISERLSPGNFINEKMEVCWQAQLMYCTAHMRFRGHCKAQQVFSISKVPYLEKTLGIGVDAGHDAYQWPTDPAGLGGRCCLLRRLPPYKGFCKAPHREAQVLFCCSTLSY